jgi:hypothetical protein
MIFISSPLLGRRRGGEGGDVLARSFKGALDMRHVRIAGGHAVDDPRQVRHGRQEFV